MMESFEILLNESIEIHGHLCPGQVIGVRLAILGLELIGIDDPKGKDKKNIYVYAEINRCATEAIQSVTGCSLEEKNFNLIDIGVMAATFVNLETDVSYRVLAKESSRELSSNYFPEIMDNRQRQLEAYKIMPNNDLFTVQKVSVDISNEVVPCKQSERVQCESCGALIQGNIEVQSSGKVKCNSCSGKSYYNIIN